MCVYIVACPSHAPADEGKLRITSVMIWPKQHHIDNYKNWPGHVVVKIRSRNTEKKCQLGMLLPKRLYPKKKQGSE